MRDHLMITCTPMSLCSWSFCLEGGGHRANLGFDWWTEQGNIVVDGVHFDVRKHGALSGQWTLEGAGQQVAIAQKMNVFTRTFQTRSSAGTMELRAEALVGRSFRLEQAGQLLARIAPIHPFTRRATIEARESTADFQTLAFAFWLVVLTWRRAARNSS